MISICQPCGARIDIPYFMLGAFVTCRECGKRIVLQAVAGALPSYTGYEITFSGFHRLLSDPEYRPAIAPLLREWYGYELEALDNSVRILSGDDNEVDELTLHQRIQNDSPKQSALYRAAMTLWR